MQRIYPKVETKICIGCKRIFNRKKHYFGAQWIRVKYCSRQCFGKKLSVIKYELYKDETKHPRWKGDNVGYYGVHDWITKHFGQPKKCEVCGLNDKKRKYHWANLTDDYLRDRSNCKRMCVSCHRLYDYRRSNKKLAIASKSTRMV